MGMPSSCRRRRAVSAASSWWLGCNAARNGLALLCWNRFRLLIRLSNSSGLSCQRRGHEGGAQLHRHRVDVRVRVQDVENRVQVLRVLTDRAGRVQRISVAAADDVEKLRQLAVRILRQRRHPPARLLEGVRQHHRLTAGHRDQTQLLSLRALAEQGRLDDVDQFVQIVRRGRADLADHRVPDCLIARQRRRVRADCPPAARRLAALPDHRRLLRPPPGAGSRTDAGRRARLRCTSRSRQVCGSSAKYSR